MASPQRSPDSISSSAGFRPDFSFFGGIIIITAIALFFLVMLAFILSDMPGRTLYFLFAGPFRNVLSFGNMLNAMIPLVLGGLGVSIAMQTGNLNLGGEGQIYSGAFVATVTAIALAPLGHFGAFAAALAGSLFAGIIAAISGLCKARWNTNELITSFLLSNALILIVNYFVDGPFLDPQTNLQATKEIPAAFKLPLVLPPSRLSASLFVALSMLVIVHVFIKKTVLGYEFRMAGFNEMFARYGGINTGRNTVFAMFFSGVLYGLSGSMMVFGTYYRTVREFSAGLGWNSLAAALVAGFYPPALLPSGFFFAWISSGARIAMQNSDITFELAQVVHAVILFLVTSVVLRKLFLQRKRRKNGR